MYSTNWMTKWIVGGAITVKLVRGKCWFWRIIQCGAFGPATSTRIALQFLLNIPVLCRGVNCCIVSPRIKDLRSQLCFLSLPPSITVVSEKDNLIKNNKNFKYDSTVQIVSPCTTKRRDITFFVVSRRLLLLTQTILSVTDKSVTFNSVRDF